MEKVNRTFFILAFLILSFFSWATDTNVVTLPDKNGFWKIEAISSNIIRFRFNLNNDFPLSITEKYGIIQPISGSISLKSEKTEFGKVFSINGVKIFYDEVNAFIRISDNDGNPIISNITVPGSEQFQLYEKIKGNISNYFSDLKSGGGIIGDPNFEGEKAKTGKVDLIPDSRIIQISLKEGERFYGGGSTSRKNIQHRGDILRMWATYQRTEIPMPFLMSSNGWGILNNNTSLNFFDIGYSDPDKLTILNSDGVVDFYLFLGKNMKDVLNYYTQLTGRPYLLPKWAYGMAFGSNTNEKQFDVLNNAVRFRDEDIPCDIYWLEPQWMEKNYDFSTSKNWNLEKFSTELSWDSNKRYENKLLFPAKLHGLGFKLALWLCIDHDLSIEEEDRYAQKNKLPLSGKEHWFGHLTKFIDQGVDGFKLDPGMTLDEHPDRKYYNGLTDKVMHNLNQVLLSKQMYTTFREHKGIRSFHHYCGGYIGSQHWGASTSGDNGGGKNSLYDQLNLGMSSFTNTSVDVMEVHENNKAAIHFGFFLPWVQVNSWYAFHHPWYLEKSDKETFKYYAQLRNRLHPYIYSTAIEGALTGTPILRPMPLEFPDDRNCDNLIYQYMFGKNILVGAFSDSVYLPKGKWINYWTGQTVNGGKYYNKPYPENKGGHLFIKSGAILPYQKLMDFIGEYPVDTLVVDVFPDGESDYTLYTDDGSTFDYEKGKVSTTKFNCTQTSNNLIITINNDSSQTVFKNFQFNITSKSPKKVIVDGNKTNNWNYDKTNNKLSLVAQNPNKIEITY